MNGFKLVGSIVAASWIVQAVSWQSPSSSTETRSDFAYCRVVLDKLSAQQADELRDLAQLWGLHHRRRDDAEAFISVNKHPRPEAHFVKAYATHKSLEQLEAERDGAETLRRSYEKQFQGNVTALLERGVLSPGTPGSRVLECVVARLTPKLYSPRPVVSFVANYYKYALHR